MNSILIAYNSNPYDITHSFFQSCADEVRQLCLDSSINYESKTGNELAERDVILDMEHHSLCILASHGSYDSIVNEDGNEVLSARTTNYAFKGKGLYAISCLCAQGLLPELCRIGLSLFVGYNDVIRFSGDDSVFVNCALSGLKCFISGNNFDQSKSEMLNYFDEAIKKAENSANPFEKMFLLHNKESLVFYGDPELMFTDLS